MLVVHRFRSASSRFVPCRSAFCNGQLLPGGSRTSSSSPNPTAVSNGSLSSASSLPHASTPILVVHTRLIDYERCPPEQYKRGLSYLIQTLSENSTSRFRNRTANGNNGTQASQGVDGGGGGRGNGVRSSLCFSSLCPAGAGAGGVSGVVAEGGLSYTVPGASCCCYSINSCRGEGIGSCPSTALVEVGRRGFPLCCMFPCLFVFGKGGRGGSRDILVPVHAL